MQIKEVDGEKLLLHCAWKIAKDCEDRYKDMQAIEHKAQRLGIEKISSGICKKCLEVLNMQFDGQE